MDFDVALHRKSLQLDYSPFELLFSAKKSRS